jgi:hypothetical protein
MMPPFEEIRAYYKAKETEISFMQFYRITIAIENGIVILWIKANSIIEAHQNIVRCFL